MTAPEGEVTLAMKVKKAGFLTKIVVLILLVAGSVCLLQLQSRIADAQVQRDQIQVQVTRQKQLNADLEDAVEHSDDPQRQAELAREKLDMVAPGEKVIIFTD